MNARELALVVRDVFPAPGAGAQRARSRSTIGYAQEQASRRERAFATELAYGAIKMRRALEWYCDRSRGALSSMPAVVREILRLAAYELIYTRADEHATVFEFVNLAKRYGHRGLANLVNAVLRSFLRDRPGPPPRVAFENDDEYLATRFSLPTGWCAAGASRSASERKRFARAVNDPARTAIVVNRV